MESQVIKISRAKTIIVKMDYEDIDVYSKLIYWMIDIGVEITPALEEEATEHWLVSESEGIYLSEADI